MSPPCEALETVAVMAGNAIVGVLAGALLLAAVSAARRLWAARATAS